MLYFLLFFLGALNLLAQRSVIILPAGSAADPNNRNATILDVDTWLPIGSPAVGMEAFNALTLPSGQKTYVISKSRRETITVLKALSEGGQVLKSIDLPGGLTDAILTPDGKRLLVVSMADTALTVINTFNDRIMARIPLAAPANSVVVNTDASLAFVASPEGAVITSVDILRNLKAKSAVLPARIQDGSPLAIAPGGLLYIVAGASLYQIDPLNLTWTAGKTPLSASAGRLLFPNRSTHALIAQPDSLTYAPLRHQQQSGVLSSQRGFNHLRAVSESTAIGYSSADRTLYRIDLNQALSAKPLPQLAAVTESGIVGFGGTHEDPANRLLFVSSGNVVYRIDAASQIITAEHKLNHRAGLPVLPPTPSTARMDDIYGVDPLQVAVDGKAGPMTARVLDSKGLPVADRAVTLTLAGSNTSTAYSNSQGYLQSAWTVPAGSGFLWVSSYSPDGDIRGRQFAIATTPEAEAQMFTPLLFDNSFSAFRLADSGTKLTNPLEVVVASSALRLLGSVPVDWEVVQGAGRLAWQRTLTDSKGVATNEFTGPTLPGPGPMRTTIRASAAGSRPAELKVITLPPAIADTGLAIPGLTRLSPIGPLNLRGRVGTRLPLTLKYHLTTPSESVPGIALEFGRGPGGVNISCQTYDVVTDGAGVVGCDLELGVIAGKGKVPVLLAGRYVEDITVEITPEPPSVIRIVSGYEQIPVAGQDLPRPLVARVQDGWGNPVDGLPVNWLLASGNVTLFDTKQETGPGSFTDPRNPGVVIRSGGLVSTRVRIHDWQQPVRIVATLPSGYVASNPFYNNAVFSFSNPATNQKPTPDTFYGTLGILDGCGQVTPVGSEFMRPLVIQALHWETGAPVVGVPVNFTGAGLTPLSPSSVTDIWGRTEATISGIFAGRHSLKIMAGTASVSCDLTVTP